MSVELHYSRMRRLARRRQPGFRIDYSKEA